MRSTNFLRILTSQSPNFVQSAQFSRSSVICLFLLASPENERKNPLLGPNKGFPFPGDVKCSIIVKEAVSTENETKTLYKSDIFRFCTPMNGQRAIRILLNSDIQPNKHYKPDDVPYFQQLSGQLKMYIDIAKCPRLLKRAVRTHFSNIDWSQDNIYTISLIQKIDILEENTHNPTFESTEENSNLKQLFKYFFVEVAERFCAELERSNYWADFIDPRSGQPHGNGPSQSILQHDGQLAQSGFEVSNVEFCKLIKDVEWDNQKMLVGTIFTDAPLEVDSFILKEIIEKLFTSKPMPAKSSSPDGTKENTET